MIRRSAFILSILAALFCGDAYAKPELVAKTATSQADFRFVGELYFDRVTKKADLWMEYEQTHGPEKISFTATSLQDRLATADTRLKANPVAHQGQAAVLIFDGYEIKTGSYDINRGIAILFRFPTSDLPKPTVDALRKSFPTAFGPASPVGPLEAGGTYVKALVARITEVQVYPIAAFDADVGDKLR